MGSKGASKGAKGGPGEKRGPATIENRRARHDYEFIEQHEAGIVLVGSEVKSVYLGRAHLSDAHCRIKDGELWLLSSDIEPYDKAGSFGHDRRRDRKLLMHRKEIDLLRRKSEEKGLAIIPYKLYFKGGRVKVGIALARGKREYDKREAIKKRETRREIEREMR
jgi:SsrA-binding protein